MDPELTSLKNKKNFKWAKALNTKDKTTKLLKDSLGGYEIVFSRKGFVKPDTIIQKERLLCILKIIIILKGKIKELHVKINNFYSSKTPQRKKKKDSTKRVK